MKKIILVMLATAMAIALTGCEEEEHRSVPLSQIPITEKIEVERLEVERLEYEDMIFE